MSVSLTAVRKSDSAKTDKLCLAFSADDTEEMDGVSNHTQKNKH